MEKCQLSITVPVSQPLHFKIKEVAKRESKRQIDVVHMLLRPVASIAQTRPNIRPLPDDRELCSPGQVDMKIRLKSDLSTAMKTLADQHDEPLSACIREYMAVGVEIYKEVEPKQGFPLSVGEFSRRAKLALQSRWNKSEIVQ